MAGTYRKPRFSWMLILLLFAAFDWSASRAYSFDDTGTLLFSASYRNPVFGEILSKPPGTERRSIPIPMNDQPLEYSIFQGKAALRQLDPWTESRYHGIGHKTILAVLLLLEGNSDASHEVLLGVTPDSVEEAEYAATHRGKTDWAERHPLSDVDDLVHGLVHLWEGSHVGEGNHVGFDNAKYWFAGGPKEYYDSAKLFMEASTHRPVLEALSQWAIRNAPGCADLGIVNQSHQPIYHSIIAGGARDQRQVCVRPGWWDPFKFVDLVAERRSLSTAIQNELEEIHTTIFMLVCCHELLQQRRSEVTVSTLLSSLAAGPS